MSVTFTIESNPTGRFVLSPACAEPGFTGTFDGSDAYVDYDAAVAALVEHKATCEDCSAYGCYSQAQMDTEDTLDVNVSNMNARDLLKRLDLVDDEEDLYGTLDGEDFLGRTLLALGMNEPMADAGVIATVDSAPGRATWIECGVEPGYYDRTFRRLHDLAAEAVRLGRAVTWS